MPKPRTGDALLDALLATAHHLRTDANERLRAHGLSLARFKVLQLLEKNTLKMREVSDALGVVPRTLTSTVDGLETEGLVQREADPGDRRATRLRLTAAGLRRFHEARGMLEAAHHTRAARLSAAERTQFLQLLARLREE
jgi:DNA-binding MarR family transcriptional regulator